MNIPVLIQTWRRCPGSELTVDMGWLCDRLVTLAMFALENPHRCTIIRAYVANILPGGKKGRFWKEIQLAFKETSLYLE